MHHKNKPPFFKAKISLEDVMSLLPVQRTKLIVPKDMMSEFDLLTNGANVEELRKSFEALSFGYQLDIIWKLKELQGEESLIDNLEQVNGTLILFNNEFTACTPQGAYDVFFSIMTDNLEFQMSSVSCAREQ